MSYRSHRPWYWRCWPAAAFTFAVGEDVRYRTLSEQQLEQWLPMPPTNHSTQPDHCSAGAGSTHCCRRKFITRATWPPGAPRDPGPPSQALWVGEDRTWPPCPRSGRSASRAVCGVQTERAPWGAPKRRRSGWANDRALRDWHHQRVQSRQRGLEWIRVLGNVSCAAREGTGYCLLEEIRWRPPKCDSRVPATLVSDGAAPRTQESHPSTLGGLGAHNERFNPRFPLDATPLGGHHLTSNLRAARSRPPR